MARGKAYDDQIRAQVIAALMSGQGVREVSRALGVPVATVSRLKKELAPMVREAAEKLSAADCATSCGTNSLDERSDEEATADGLDEAFQGGDAGGHTPQLTPLVGTQKRALPELVAELLATNVETLAHIAQFVRCPSYLCEQDANDLAVLYGVMADKTIRILEAHAAAQPLEKP